MLAHLSATDDAHHDADRAREVYQTSTMGALIDGVYEGDVTIGELLRHGDFGLGTFNRLDGEMLVLDGVCYRLRADGSARIADSGDLTPFAAVTRFTADTTIPVTAASDRKALTGLIDEAVSSENLIYAVRVTGVFSEIRTRTVMEQNPPYPPLAEAAKGQKENHFSDMAGTLAGYRTPDYEQGISVAGYHLHFIDQDHQHGGHALDYRLHHGKIEISVRSELHLSMPRTPQFLESNLTADNIAAQIRRAEGG
jgi:acetolactate decarboxylase